MRRPGCHGHHLVALLAGDHTQELQPVRRESLRGHHAGGAASTGLPLPPESGEAEAGAAAAGGAKLDTYRIEYRCCPLYIDFNRTFMYIQIPQRAT